MAGRAIDEQLVLSFSFKNIYNYLREGGADLLVRVFEAITVTKNMPAYTDS